MDSFNKLVKKQKVILDQDIRESLKKHNLPENGYVIKRICDIALADGAKHSIDDYVVSAKDSILEELEDFIPGAKEKRRQQKLIDQFNKEMHELIYEDQ